MESLMFHGYFKSTQPFKISGDKFVDENNQPIDVSNLFEFIIDEYTKNQIDNIKENQLYKVTSPLDEDQSTGYNIKQGGGGKSKKKRGGNKRKTKSNRNKR